MRQDIKMKTETLKKLWVPFFVFFAGALTVATVGCSSGGGSQTGTAGKTGTAGTTGEAGTGVAGTGVAGTGVAGTGVAGTGAAGSTDGGTDAPPVGKEVVYANAV